MEITKDYVKGIMELSGGFFIHKSGYLMFKISSKKADFYQQITDFLFVRHEIMFHNFKGKFVIVNRASISNLIKYMEKYLNRDDYKKYLNRDDVKIGEKK